MLYMAMNKLTLNKNWCAFTCAPTICMLVLNPLWKIIRPLAFVDSIKQLLVHNLLQQRSDDHSGSQFPGKTIRKGGTKIHQPKEPNLCRVWRKFKIVGTSHDTRQIVICRLCCSSCIWSIRRSRGVLAKIQNGKGLNNMNAEMMSFCIATTGLPS